MTFEEIRDGVNSAWRDYVIKGVPATGRNEPVKQEIRAALLKITVALENGGFSTPPNWAADLADVQSKLGDIDAVVAGLGTVSAKAVEAQAAASAAAAARDDAVEIYGSIAAVQDAAGVATDAVQQIADMASGAPDAPSILNKAEKAANLADMANKTQARANLHLLRKVPEDYGAAGDGATDDGPAVAALIANTPIGGEVYLNDRDYLVSSVDDIRGVRFRGPGRLIGNYPGGGKVQFNTYADDGKPYLGREYLKRLFDRFKLGGTLTAHIFGNSTVATAANGGGYAGVAGEPQNLIPLILKRKGVRNAMSFTNHAQGGTKIADMNALPHIDTVGGATDLFIISYGINDAADGVDAFQAAMDAKLSAIRSSSHGRPDLLTIMLIGPNATFDPDNGHDQRWYERIRQIYVRAARKHRCFYFDVYADLKDVSWAPGIATPAPYIFDGIHPNEEMQVQIWSHVWDAAIGFSDLVLYDNNDPVGMAGANGWVNYTTGADGFAVASCWMNKDGEVDAEGELKGGSTAAWTTIAVFPEGYRPIKNYTAVLNGDNAEGYGMAVPVRVTLAGEVQLMAALPANTRIGLRGLRHRTR